jgi:hypothetical protein
VTIVGKKSNAFSQLEDVGIPDLGILFRTHVQITWIRVLIWTCFISIWDWRKILQNQQQKAPAPQPGQKVVNTNAKPQAKDNEFVNGLLGVLTM